MSVLTGKTISARNRFWTAILVFSKEKPLGALSGGVFVIMIVIAIIGRWITPYDPLSTDIPAMLSSPSLQHWLGTDAIGRDLLSRLLAGTQTALLVGLTASFLGTSIGALLGIISGCVFRSNPAIVSE